MKLVFIVIIKKWGVVLLLLEKLRKIVLFHDFLQISAKKFERDDNMIVTFFLDDTKSINNYTKYTQNRKRFRKKCEKYYDAAWNYV